MRPTIAHLKVPRIVGYISSLAALTVAVRIAGFFDKIVLTAFFDLANLEALFIAISLPMMTYSVVAAIVNPIVLPGFAGKLGAGDSRGAVRQLQGWLLVLIPLLLAVTGLIMLFPDAVATVLAPGFDLSRRQFCATLLLKLAPLNVVMGLVPLLSAFQNAQRAFSLPAFGELAMKVTATLFVLAMAKTWGMTAPVLGVAMGMLAYLAILAATSWKTCALRPSVAFLKEPEFKKMLVLMIAPCLGTVVARVGEIAERAAASTLAPGSVAALTLARKLVDLPLLIISLTAATVLFTYFAELNQAGDRREVARLMDTGMRIMILIFLPITILTCLLSEPIVSVVYQRGEFDAQAAYQVSQALFWLAPSMTFLALEMLLMRHFFSRLDVWTPTVIGLACVGGRIGLLWLLVGRWEIFGVALAITGSRIIKVAALFLVMRKWRQPALVPQSLADCTKIAAAALAAGIACLAVLMMMNNALTSSTLSRASVIISAGGAGVAAYAGAILILWRGNLQQALFPRNHYALTASVQMATKKSSL